MTHKIILDTDPGIDDAMAFFFAEGHQAIEIVGITTIFGNVATAQSTANALRLLDIVTKNYPVAHGEEAALTGPPRPYPDFVHGSDGFGDINWPASARQPATNNAVDFIIDTIKANPNEITLVPIGPLTNIARALTRAPEIAKLVPQVALMGGAGFCRGNVTPLAEANIANDPEAADIVFGGEWPVVMLGLDVTLKTIIGMKDFEQIKLANPKIGEFLAQAAEVYIKFYQKAEKVDGCCMHDVCALAILVVPELFELQTAKIRVETEGFSRGKTAIMPAGFPASDAAWSARPNQRIALGVDGEALRKLFVDTLSNY